MDRTLVTLEQLSDWVERLSAMRVNVRGPDEGEILGMRIDSYRCESLSSIIAEMRQVVLDGQRARLDGGRVLDDAERAKAMQLGLTWGFDHDEVPVQRFHVVTDGGRPLCDATTLWCCGGEIFADSVISCQPCLALLPRVLARADKRRAAHSA